MSSPSWRWLPSSPPTPRRLRAASSCSVSTSGAALDFYGPALSVYTGAKIKQFYEDGVAYEMGGEVKELHGFDSIILSLGVKSYNPLEEVAKYLCGEVYVVGDAEAAGNANHATDTGLAAALKL